jgi:hypothetical protein
MLSKSVILWLLVPLVEGEARNEQGELQRIFPKTKQLKITKFKF